VKYSTDSNIKLKLISFFQNEIMKILYILFLLMFWFSAAEAQWTNQNIVPDGNHLWSTFFVDDNIGWIAGSDGFIKKTTNAGLDWVEQNGGTTLTLKSIQFIDQHTGWICGEAGLIIKTTDGGQNWIELSSGTIELLTDLIFYDVNIGYAVGFNETIIKTTNGGINWVTQQSGSTYDLYSVDFVDSLLGFAAGGRDSSDFLKTVDGGLTWVKKTLTLGAINTPIINCVEFIDANVGWVGSEGQFLNHSGNISKTTDGGETWFSTILNRPSQGESSTAHNEEDNLFDTQRGIRSLYFKDSNNGYAVGGTRDGWWRSIYSTTDAGNTWQKKYGYSEQTGLLSVFVNSNGIGWAVGYRGVMYKTNNDGSSWNQILSGTQAGYTGDWISSVFMINDSVGWAAGYRKGIWYYPIILKTTTGGKIWETNKEFSNSFNRTQTNIFFITENIGWVSFYDRGSYKTTNGGNNWFANGNGGNEKYFINQDTGWGTYAPFGIYKSTDGGSNWVQKSNISSNSVYFSDLNNGWAVGNGGSILKSSDGGESWFSKTSGTTSDLNSVNFYHSNLGMCVGSSGAALLTTDGGENWIQQNIGSSANLNSVVFTNAATVWVSGSLGTILNTTDLGTSWYSNTGVTEENLESSFFINETTGWFAGWNGTIIKYQNFIVPVELISFTFEVIDNSVQLNWQTATEVNNYGFEIERKIDESDWNNIGFVLGHGSSTSVKSYSFTDNGPKSGTKIKYRLKQIDLNGNYEFSNEIEIEIVPSKFTLFQNYPNPFNPSTKIRYQLPNESKVVIKIYTILGSEVMELVNDKKEAGGYEVEFNADNLSSGTYIYRIVAGEFVETRKMSLIK
jgi:photosystem II stability/assembly factor-like uncharacterized protein